MAATKPKIFVAEDELITAQHLRQRLSRLGYEVIGVAASGLEALRRVGETQPDLLLADIGLQGDMDGIAVADEVQKCWHIPTVFLTAYTDPETMRRVRSCEPYGYLVKPFADPELHAAIEIALQQRSLAEQLERQSQTNSVILEHTREELAAVAGRLFSAQEDERARIARDLHDDIVQRLVVVEFDIEQFHQSLPPEVRALTASSCEALHASIGEIAADLRDVSHQLHPSVLDDLGLPAALRRLADDFEQRHEMACRVSTRRVPERIPAHIALALYRIAQEALRNVSRHAGPAAVHIFLLGGPGRLDLSISDNGCGFDQEKGRKGLGLVSMAQRAELVGGTLDLRTGKQLGTRIRVRVPLAAAGSLPEKDEQYPVRGDDLGTQIERRAASRDPAA
jgi:signal transduction histidine kinase